MTVKKFQGSKSLLICDWVRLFDDNLLSQHSNLLYNTRRFEFKVKILKEIHNNYSDLQGILVWLLADTVLLYFTFSYQIDETNFLLFRKISTNATLEFGNRCCFKEMNFYRHEFSELIQTVALGILSSLIEKVLNYMIIFLSNFPFRAIFFMALRRNVFEISKKLQ